MRNMVKKIVKFMVSDIGLAILMFITSCVMLYIIADVCYETLEIHMWHLVTMLLCASFILSVLLSVTYSLIVYWITKSYKSALHRTLKYDKKEHTWIKNIN